MLDRAIVKQLTSNSIGELFSRVFTLLAQLLIAKQIGPKMFGVWVLLQLTVNYNNLFSFGIITGLSREEPLLLGKGEIEEAKTLRSSALFALIIVSFFIAILVFFASFLPLHFISNHQGSIRIISFMVICQQLFIFFQTVYSNHLLFYKLSIGKIIYSTAYLILTILVLSYHNINFLLIVWMGSLALAVLYYAFAETELKFSMKYDYIMLKQVFSSGVPMFLTSLLKLCLTSVDKVLISFFIGALALGYYSSSLIYLSIVVVLLGQFARVFFPNVMKKITSNNTKHIVIDYFNSLYQINVIVACGLVLLSFFYYIVVTCYMMEYTPGINAGMVLICCSYFMGQSLFLIDLMSALGEYKKCLYVTFLALSVTAVSIFIDLNYFTGTILSVSLVTLVCWLIYTIVMFNQCCIDMRLTKKVHIFLNCFFYPFSIAAFVIYVYRMAMKLADYNYSIVGSICLFIIVLLILLFSLLRLVKKSFRSSNDCKSY